MTICDSTFDALDRRFEKKMNIDDIAKELCKGSRDPRVKIIRLIKAYKGKEWLCENADWLGYKINYVRDSEEIPEEQFSSESEIYKPGKLFKILKDNSNLTTDKEGIVIWGCLKDGIVAHFCYIDPDTIEGYHTVLMWTYKMFEPYERGKEPNDNIRSVQYDYVRDECIDLVIDMCFYPESYIQQLRNGLDETSGFKHPKLGKSALPEWGWHYYLDERKNPNY
jgi:hypothetical protein